jgi:hypothetical protein
LWLDLHRLESDPGGEWERDRNGLRRSRDGFGNGFGFGQRIGFGIRKWLGIRQWFGIGFRVGEWKWVRIGIGFRVGRAEFGTGGRG